MAKRDKVTLVLPTGMNNQLKVLAKQLGCSMSTLVGRLCQERLELANLWPPHNLNQPRRILRENPRSVFSPLQLGLEDKLPADAEEAKFIEDTKRLVQSLQQKTHIYDTRECPGVAVVISSAQAYELSQALQSEEESKVDNPLYFRRGQ